MLSKDYYTRIRLAVAENASTPSYVLEGLANDESFLVRLCAVSNASLDADWIVSLAVDLGAKGGISQ